MLDGIRNAVVAERARVIRLSNTAFGKRSLAKMLCSSAWIQELGFEASAFEIAHKRLQTLELLGIHPVDLNDAIIGGRLLSFGKRDPEWIAADLRRSNYCVEIVGICNVALIVYSRRNLRRVYD